MKNLSIALILVFLFVLSGCFGKDDNIKEVKKGVISDQTSVSVGQVFDSKFDSPSWKIKRTFNGQFLEFKGVITQQLHDSLVASESFRSRPDDFSKVGDEVKAQFQIAENENSLKLVYLRSKSWAGIDSEQLIKVIYL